MGSVSLLREGLMWRENRRLNGVPAVRHHDHGRDETADYRDAKNPRDHG